MHCCKVHCFGSAVIFGFFVGRSDVYLSGRAVEPSAFAAFVCLVAVRTIGCIGRRQIRNRIINWAAVEVHSGCTAANCQPHKGRPVGPSWWKVHAEIDLLLELHEFSCTFPSINAQSFEAEQQRAEEEREWTSTSVKNSSQTFRSEWSVNEMYHPIYCWSNLISSAQLEGAFAWSKLVSVSECVCRKHSLLQQLHYIRNKIIAFPNDCCLRRFGSLIDVYISFKWTDPGQFLKHHRYTIHFSGYQFPWISPSGMWLVWHGHAIKSKLMPMPLRLLTATVVRISTQTMRWFGIHEDCRSNIYVKRNLINPLSKWSKWTLFILSK